MKPSNKHKRTVFFILANEDKELYEATKRREASSANFALVYYIAYHPIYVLSLPANHRFPIEKYALLPEQLLYEGTATPEQFFMPSMASNADILRVHQKSYFDKFVNGQLSASAMRKIGFPWSEQLVEREIRIAGGTIEACYHALQTGIAFNIAGGTHHAYADAGEGFCMLNDQAIAAAHVLEKKMAKQILIIDLDVHQGNGTAAIFKDEARVFTCSLHGRDNYPLHKEISDLDVALPAGIEDEAYLNTLTATLKAIKNRFQADFIFYQAGVDVLATDKLGKLSLSLAGCAQRDRLVMEWAKAQQIPMVVCMGGGYSPDIRHILEAHANTYRIARELY